MRPLGVGVTGFDGSGQSQGLLFEHDEQKKHRQLDTVIDQIKERFDAQAGLVGLITLVDGVLGQDAELLLLQLKCNLPQLISAPCFQKAERLGSA